MSKTARKVTKERLSAFRDYVQSTPKVSKFFQTNSTDKRTIRSTQRITQELTRHEKASTIANRLGVSTQKWVAIRKQVNQGKAYSPELRDTLKGVKHTITREKIAKTVAETKDTFRNSE